MFGGVLRPGTRVDQEALARRLGVSKLPVREALIALEGEGIIQVVPRRGAYVAQLSREDIRDHYWMLGAISGLAAERASVNLSDDDLGELDRIATAMEDDDTAESNERLNFEFHRVINRGARSRRLISELKMLSSAIPTGFYDVHPEWVAWGLRDHREILDALCARSGGMAKVLTEGHFLRGGNQAVALLEAQGFWAD
ncbi:putative GntR family transcriptional regulator [Gordonia rhizosphera NBRC 16068]|uniref:Putative GntR family transcriptional regulator n=1 Tax=Gordonia rhizosphera NBRC 16068 TaxID=1108045 RepID=K6WBX9_9ACTN|nr:putative GntR family transcriptional regulator [Gordonia rhizosphera NBRC 16068]